MKGIVSALMAGGLVFAVACNNEPEEKIAEARKDVAEARTDAAKKETKAVEKINKAEADAAEKVADARADAAKDINKAESKVMEQQKDLAETQMDVAKDKADAQTKLNERLRDLEARAAVLRTQMPTVADAGAKDRLGRLMAHVDQTLSDARTRISAFTAYQQTDWQAHRDAANEFLDRADKALDTAEDYKNPDVAIPPATVPATAPR